MGIYPDLRRDERYLTIKKPVFTLSCPQQSSSLTSNEKLHLAKFLNERWMYSPGNTHIQLNRDISLSLRLYATYTNLDEIFENCIVGPSISPWSFSIFIIPKNTAVIDFQLISGESTK